MCGGQGDLKRIADGQEGDFDLTTTLYLVRHAKSSWRDPSLPDFDRPLRNKGRRRAKALALWLHQNKMPCQHVLCSSALRTRQTLDILLPALADPMVEFEPKLYFRMNEPGLVGLLGNIPDTRPHVMVVGHEPLLRWSAIYLAGSATGDALDRLDTNFPTSAMAVLTFGSASWNSLAPRMGHLELFLVPSA